MKKYVVCRPEGATTSEARDIPSRASLCGWVMQTRRLRSQWDYSSSAAASS